MVMGIRRADYRAAAIIVIVALLIVASVSACANQPRQHIGGARTRLPHRIAESHESRH